MKFNRQHLEELTLQKKYQDLRNIIDHIIGWIKAGHSISLDTIEYIEVVLSEHDKNMNNDQIKAYSDQTIEIQELKKTIQDLTAELEEYRSIAEKIGAEKAVSEKAKWEEIADMLFVYAEEVKCGTHNQALWEAACQDIEKYRKLKETTNGTIQN